MTQISYWFQLSVFLLESGAVFPESGGLPESGVNVHFITLLFMYVNKVDIHALSSLNVLHNSKTDLVYKDIKTG